MKGSLSFDPDDHTYYLDGTKVPSVTQVIGSCKLSDYSQVPPDVLATKAQLGRDVHLAAELLDNHDLDDESVSDDVAPYLDGWRAFLSDYSTAFELVEEPLASEKYRFGGTIDRLARIGGTLCLIDIKTSIGTEWHKIQLAAYALLLRENGHRPQFGFNIYLNPRGGFTPMRYRAADLKADEACFLSALNVHKWKQIKGYFNGKS